jgi:hypothetical protein
MQQFRTGFVFLHQRETPDAVGVGLDVGAVVPEPLHDQADGPRHRLGHGDLLVEAPCAHRVPPRPLLVDVEADVDIVDRGLVGDRDHDDVQHLRDAAGDDRLQRVVAVDDVHLAVRQRAEVDRGALDEGPALHRVGQPRLVALADLALSWVVARLPELPRLFAGDRHKL